MKNAKDHDVRYWNERFLAEGLIWEDGPSEGAVKAGEFLAQNAQPQRILDVGCGYGRDLVCLAQYGHEVMGVDFSAAALKLGRSFSPASIFVQADVLHLPYRRGEFDLVYGYYILHLFNAASRAMMLQESARILRAGGHIIQTVASVSDSDYGHGEEKEPRTFVNKRGVAKCYYTREAIYEEFSAFEVLSIEEIRIHHTHGEPHDHFNFFIMARKSG